MAAGLIVGKLVHYAITGTIGSLIVKGAAAARPWAGPATRRVAVRAVAGGIVGGRKLGDWAEEARLQSGDLVADARASLGEVAPAPNEEPAAPAEANGANPPPAKKAARRAAPRKSAKTDDGHGH